MMIISDLYCVDHYLANHHTFEEIQDVSFTGLIGFFSPDVLHQICLMPVSILCISFRCQDQRPEIPDGMRWNFMITETPILLRRHQDTYGRFMRTTLFLGKR